MDISGAYKFPFGLGLAFSAGSGENSNGVTTSENVWFQATYDFGKVWTVSAGFGQEDQFAGDTVTGVGEDLDNDLLILSLLWKPNSVSTFYFNFGDWSNGIAAGEIEEDNDDSNVFALGGHLRF